MDPVDALVVALPRWISGGAVGHPWPRGVLYAEAEFLDVSHGVGVDVGVADVVVALAQFLLAGDPDLGVSKVLAHLHRLSPGFNWI